MHITLGWVLSPKHSSPFSVATYSRQKCCFSLGCHHSDSNWVCLLIIPAFQCQLLERGQGSWIALLIPSQTNLEVDFAVQSQGVTTHIPESDGLWDLFWDGLKIDSGFPMTLAYLKVHTTSLPLFLGSYYTCHFWLLWLKTPCFMKDSLRRVKKKSLSMANQARSGGCFHEASGAMQDQGWGNVSEVTSPFSHWFPTFLNALDAAKDPVFPNR